MQPIRSFIVRIYRRDRRDIAGVVEDVRSGRSVAFSSLAGLWAALTRPVRRPPATRNDPTSPRRDDP